MPLPLVVLRRALGECFSDGMVTTKPELLGEAYRLPLSAAGQAIESQGQRSLLLFAAVPVLPPRARGGACGGAAQGMTEERALFGNNRGTCRRSGADLP